MQISAYAMLSARFTSAERPGIAQAPDFRLTAHVRVLEESMQRLKGIAAGERRAAMMTDTVH
jgi:hypothetical protein